MKILNYLSLFMSIFCAIPAYCQNIDPDAQYKNEVRSADSLSRQVNRNKDSVNRSTNAKRATQIFSKLSKKYRLPTTEIVTFFNISIVAEDEGGFYTASKLMILNSGLPISNILNEYYGSDSKELCDRQPFVRVLEKIRKEEPALIRQAKLNLDWNWNLKLSALYNSDQVFRMIPRESFKDENARTEAMIGVDSVNMVEFCKYISENGFPAMSKVGLNAAEIQVLLRHFTGLISSGQRGDFYIEEWKLLVPYLHTAAIHSEMDSSYYNHIYDWLTQALEEANKGNSLDYFKKFVMVN